VTPSDYIRLAKYCQKAGDTDGAQEAYLQAARLDGGRTVSPQLALADFYTSINDEEAAQKRIRMAYFIDPRSKAVNERMLAHGLTPAPELALTPAERP
jgi:Flp pilus assembly protein TadD